MRGTIQLVIDTVHGCAAAVTDLLASSPNSSGWSGHRRRSDRFEEYPAAGMDRTTIMSMLVASSYADFADHVIPVLQQRGLAQRDYTPGTCARSSSPGSGTRLGDNHPASFYRKLA
ncbi:hypothetical protein G6038_29175 [Rhodococcus sp. 14C212]|uniref:hypothetical protein n=1 Tax=Rhodococcus sp. 14C212 TaxID=2711209 RepID=UPI0013EBC94B|nr:hypothetical protein [Rhodococcus sp. 14C212]NGP09466.1 hypothetical protein [Rhodococcus sp. 14C212]